jgi:HD superfamily phosphohydrolase
MDFNEPLLKAVIDSQPFQRLRNLKQLGLARQEFKRISIPQAAKK